ncbi:TIGR01777 family oxidoreductase [uncultured Lutibacter sp.]|uniref:TIGR01777 family oxidoreductase n=1 Tax=uncultured Lutibacter sp. TaxID=437739 RepID=UPI0026041FAE|nr:TIGR01777 family oxidoreductase [uncultured Lutibacter sp.]
MASILVTGGTGLIGKHLITLLKKKGHHVSILSRNNSNEENIFQWNIEEKYIDEEAIKNADYIVHLAGAGIADKRWTKKRKEIIINSRVFSTHLLFQKVKELNPNLKGFIAASGVGFYGATTSTNIYTENDVAGNDFLSKTCSLWEESSLHFNSLNIRTVIFRTGIVLSKKKGALEKIVKPIKMGFGAILGNGKQYVPWIHITDLCNMYIAAIENEKYQGIYNAVTPEHTTHQNLTKQIALIFQKPLWLPNIPKLFLKIILGKMAVIILEGSRVSSQKITDIGFKFSFPSLENALNDLLKK